MSKSDNYCFPINRTEIQETIWLKLEDIKQLSDTAFEFVQILILDFMLDPNIERKKHIKRKLMMHIVSVNQLLSLKLWLILLQFTLRKQRCIHAALCSHICSPYFEN